MEGRAMVNRGFSQRRVTLRPTLLSVAHFERLKPESRMETILMRKWPLLLLLLTVTAIPVTARAAEDPDAVIRRIQADNAKLVCRKASRVRIPPSPIAPISHPHRVQTAVAQEPITDHGRLTLQLALNSGGMSGQL
jgi:hypothetical protein